MLPHLISRSRNLPLRLLSRPFTTALARHTRAPPPFVPSPSPPRLPKEEQETFDALTKASLGAFSTPPPPQSSSTVNTSSKDLSEAELLELEKHADARKGGEKPLFEGDRNPVTGEVGGPKTEPTKYGDWSFNGRVTDF
ncbi:Succinate dehydrogenase [Drechslerella dactyloides]|uniref:Succinate dehydrogenase assembly factor 4, mitochondrial n=1 Tax=Drechslerella dactyloides TaxID=74499 RepID=A0AAD6IZ82_DREDA|nr:Succinate dehydrogenase [Drechslerella dactyloides]